MKQYNKLVRDRIPEIIKRAGKTPKYHTLNDEDFKASLKRKAVEEAEELLAANDESLRKELADLAEVLDALLGSYGISSDEIAAIRKARNTERGAFAEQIFLESVVDTER
ncbi:MAG TPA: nucleoside triphosphate pyrophosphohydrolase [Candidatus Cybelea sp.]|jgi:predicted house-cleaning noncanonical NTP pyrophosphatase (MazG superfamily)